MFKVVVANTGSYAADKAAAIALGTLTDGDTVLVPTVVKAWSRNAGRKLVFLLTR